MPYLVQRRGRGAAKPWKVIDLTTGRVVASSRSRSKAQAYVRARVSAAGGQVVAYGTGGSFARSVRRRQRPRRPDVKTA